MKCENCGTLGDAYDEAAHAYRVVAFKSGDKVHLRSRNNHDFNRRYPAGTQPPSGRAGETGNGGEDRRGRQSGRLALELPPNHASSAPLPHYVFDVMMLA